MASGCAGVGRDFYQYVRSNYETWAGGDPAGAPVLYVQGMLDTIMPPAQEAACNVQRLQRAGIFENRLAAAAGMTPTQFSRSMQGRTDPRLSTMARLERAFETLVTAARA